MRTLVLDGTGKGDDVFGARLTAAVADEAGARGWPVEVIRLREHRIGACAGDFYCWTRSPGECNTNDANRMIAAAVVASDLVAQLGRTTFGGPSADLKSMIDHLIQNLSPFFTKVEGETHHHKRYRHYPGLLSVGFADEHDPRAFGIHRYLAGRNSLNMWADPCVCAGLTTDLDDRAIRRCAAGWLEALVAGAVERPPLPRLPQPSAGEPVRSATLVVGSPRTRSSSSHALGSYLMEQLASHGVATREVFVHTSVGSAARLAALTQALLSADLVALAFPLYVDSLPAPVIRALQYVRYDVDAGAVADQRRPALVALTNCGFPEAAHCDGALAVCQQFALETGMSWRGGLALGGGEGLVAGTPLAELGARAAHIRGALDLAAADLAAGRPVPEQARDAMARQVIPAWAYRTVGDLGWIGQAHSWQAAAKLGRRPYACT